MPLLRRWWRALQVSQHGAYSSQRWAALQQYQESTSTTRALVVCVLTPLPSLAFVVGVEAALPLSPIHDGLRASLHLWIRVALCAIVLAYGIMSQTRRFMPELHVTRRQLVLPALTTGLFHTLFMFAYTALWVYPLPFAIEQTSGLFVTLCVASFVLFLGTKPLREIPDMKQKLKLYFVIVLTVNALDIVYSAYGVFYRKQSAAVQAIVVLFPVAVKAVAKAFIARLCRQLKCDAYIPEVVHWSVELFHALYITVCLQTTAQPVQTAVIVFVFDFMPLAMAYRHVRQLLHRDLTPSLVSIHPYPSISEPTKKTPDVAGVKMTSDSSRRRQSLVSAEILRLRKALFAAENHLLVEYIECVIPGAYAVYVAVLYHLPNARFYTSMHSITDGSRLTQFVRTTALLVALQLVSIAAFSSRLFRGAPHKVSCLRLLAFVLETQCEMVQVWLFMWMPFCIFTRVDQAGADYTLEFAWIR